MPRPITSIRSVRPLAGYRLRLRLTDGSVVVRDVSALLADPAPPGPTTPYFTRLVRVGFDSGSTLIPAGESVQVTTHVQTPFRGARLWVWPKTADCFRIDAVTVGEVRQLGFQGGILAVRFATDTYQDQVDAGILPFSGMQHRPVAAEGLEAAIDTAPAGSAISILVENVSLAPARFWAIWYGPRIV